VAEASSALADQQSVVVLAGDKQGSSSFDVRGAEELEQHAERPRHPRPRLGLFADSHVDVVIVLQLAFDPLALGDPAREVADGISQIGPLFAGKLQNLGERMIGHRPRDGDGRQEGLDRCRGSRHGGTWRGGGGASLLGMNALES